MVLTTINTISVLGSLLKKYGVVSIYDYQNATSPRTLNAYPTRMPKRAKTGFNELTKRSNHMIPANQRLSLPRGCKRKKTLTEIFHLSYEYSKQEPSHQESKHLKQTNKVMEKEKVDSASDNNDDDLDIVFDVQEEKKNKVYEVINVASDDETPNEITYERLYADKPEDKIVIDKPKDLDASKTCKKPQETSVDTIDLFNTSDDFDLNSIVCEVVKETLIKNKEIEISMKGVSNEKIPAASTNDSDDDIVCLAVIDAKTKAEQKKASIEEICLSSDSETEVKAIAPPIRLKISSAFSQTGMYCPESSNYSRESLSPFLFQKDLHYSDPTYNWDSSSSPNLVFSKHLLNDESSSSAVNDLPPKLKAQRPTKYQPYTCSTSPSSSSEEDTTVYWQGREYHLFALGLFLGLHQFNFNPSHTI